METPGECKLNGGEVHQHHGTRKRHGVRWKSGRKLDESHQAEVRQT
jgi:hypothetical protein